MVEFLGLEVSLAEGFGNLVAVILILFFTYLFAKMARRLLEKSFARLSKKVRVDPTRYALLKDIVSAFIYVVGISAAVYFIPALRTLSISLLAGAGLAAIIIGFAAQQTFSNIISGIFLAIFRPFRVGDRVKVRDTISGVVEDITLRHTVIRNFENKRVIIPNSVISSEVIENWDIGDPKICRFVEFGISYDSDIDRAMRIMADEAMKHPEFLDNRTKEEKKEPPVTVRVTGFTDSAVQLRAWVWARSPGAAFRMGTDLNKSIKQRFDREGIEIPFPYRTIVYKKDIRRGGRPRGR